VRERCDAWWEDRKGGRGGWGVTILSVAKEGGREGEMEGVGVSIVFYPKKRTGCASVNHFSLFFVYSHPLCLWTEVNLDRGGGQ